LEKGFFVAEVADFLEKAGVCLFELVGVVLADCEGAEMAK